tara:strand:- start:2098 stop:2877 length:780 start_codon:yes stop_codon:yes gene_type:complete
MKNRIHIAPNYFFNPTHPITISLIGIGGTGSLMLARLARMDYALRQTGHSGLHVKAFDQDIVEPMNIGRQLFTPHDLGENKVVNSLTKINNAFGLQWEGIPLNAMAHGEDIKSNIIITCVDNAKYRLALSKALQYPYQGSEYETMFYWMDIGNSRNTGQFILGSLFEQEGKLESEFFEPVHKLKSIVDLFPNLKEHDTEKLQGMGCAYADKLKEQSLFINDVLVAHAADCLFRLLLNKETLVHGGFVNLENGMVNPIKV